MEYAFVPMSVDDRKAVIDIFNYYVENSFAAYLEAKVPYTFFDSLMEMSEGYPRVTAKDENGRIVGFGMLRVYNPMPAFSQVAEITCFIQHEHTGRGIGTALLEYFLDEAKKRNIRSLLASISSRNPRSIKFHEKNGFNLCGRFRDIGRKDGQLFDVVWMQRML
jgi:phosphinothricin acetyltransferase